jgi:CRISPR-associated endonuclease/helicase Cas3
VALFSTPSSPSSSPLQVLDLWAKSSTDGTSDGEYLAAHTLWVLRNLCSWERRLPRLADLCGMPGFWHRIRLAVVLHDVGKTCVGFQNLLRGKSSFDERHEILSLALVPWILGEDFQSEDAFWVAVTIATHHKNWSTIEGKYPPPISQWSDKSRESLERLRGELTPEFFSLAQELLREHVLPQMKNLGAELPEEWLLASSREWQPQDPIASIRNILDTIGQRLFDFETGSAAKKDLIAGRFFRGLMMLADHSASAHKEPGFCAALLSVNAMTAAVCSFPIEAMRFHQKEARICKGSAILVAPTGSGKTEAALMWAARQVEDGSNSDHPALFYVLPYQASMNAMFIRLGEGLAAEMPEDDRGQRIALQHSRALQSFYALLLDGDKSGDRNYGPVHAERLARRYKTLGRLHTPPVRVLGPYQLLGGAYRLPGHEALWTDAAGGLFILDEIHAYEPSRLGMILAMLRHFVRDMGAKVFFLSATMPSCLIDLLVEELDISRSSILRADQDTLDSMTRHEIHLLAAELTSDETMQRIRRDALAGKRVLVVANTVNRAQKIAKKLKDEFPQSVELLHGRFNAADRMRKESRIRSFGAGREANLGPAAILVATQVVEVSLNIDFDVLYTDPAPLEALLQRFGRVNRARKGPKVLCPVYVATEISSTLPYDEELIKASLSQLATLDGKALLETEVQRMLDQIYSGPFASQWVNNVRESMSNFKRNVLKSATPFDSGDESLQKKFAELFEGYEILPKRLLPKFEELLDTEPLKASSLLVPITKRQFWRLKGESRVEWVKTLHLFVANCEYTSEHGLDITLAVEDDGI